MPVAIVMDVLMPVSMPMSGDLDAPGDRRVFVAILLVATRIAPEEEGEAERGDDQARHRSEPGIRPPSS
jgi:hypothetical protein